MVPESPWHGCPTGDEQLAVSGHKAVATHQKRRVGDDPFLILARRGVPDSSTMPPPDRARFLEIVVADIDLAAFADGDAYGRIVEIGDLFDDESWREHPSQAGSRWPPRSSFQMNARLQITTPRWTQPRGLARRLAGSLGGPSWLLPAGA